ncbi:MAG: 6-carboxytetrahydropterin synthase QueD [Candidatus Omnitrophota bacterium]
MFKLRVVSGFSAAHNLRGYKGRCEELHGHNWRVELAVTSGRLDDVGLVVDFRKLRGMLDNVLEQLDHKYLNDMECFGKINPSSENIAKFIYGQLASALADMGIEVTVWENEGSSATYRPS